ncbi:MAG TPA: pseudouridine synthase [Candidatus Saccharibacteria bacterium]|nr:pseudouridine synthase [Candidatus Saccharibacteria bacterium]
MDSQPSRLNKELALQLGISRREADSLIERGEVSINGDAAQLGSRVTPTDTVSVKGKPLERQAQHMYFALHKPPGYVSSRKKQGRTPTIYSLLPKSLHHLKPVGRLDKDSSGLMLLTNDGDFAFRMTHPSFYKIKTYTVTLDTPLQPLHQQMITDIGVDIGDGKSQLGLERIDDSRTAWTVTMHEGRNRQIRRTFASLGYTVTGLHRLTFGAYSLGDIKPGEHEEVAMR